MKLASGGVDGYGRYQRLAKRFIQPLFRRLFPIEVIGAEHVPTHGPAVLCPNHLAAIDSFLVPSVLKREVLYVGKAEYLDDWKTSWLFPALGMIPIDRRGGDHAKAALDMARRVLEGGGLFGIYPEGTRSRTGKLYRGRTGAARLAIETGAPIIPVGLSGTADIQPVDVAVPRLFTPATVRFGQPIDVDRYRSRIGDHALYRQLIDEVMFEIQALTGQEYVPHYANQEPTAGATTANSADAASTADPAVTVDVPRSSATVLQARPLVAS